MSAAKPKLLTPHSKQLAADNARVDAVLDSLGPPITPPASAHKPAAKAGHTARNSGLPELPTPAGEKRKARRRERRAH